MLFTIWLPDSSSEMGCGVVYDGAGFPLLSLPVGVSVISSSSEGITSTSDSLLAF